MRCDEVKSEHLWLACDGEYCRATKAMFSRLQYTGTIGRWNHVGTMLWGFPCILTGNPFSFWNRLAEPEKQFKTKEDAKRDWELFPENPDPDYSEFCNDIKLLRLNSFDLQEARKPLRFQEILSRGI